MLQQRMVKRHLCCKTSPKSASSARYVLWLRCSAVGARPGCICGRQSPFAASNLVRGGPARVGVPPHLSDSWSCLQALDLGFMSDGGGDCKIETVGHYFEGGSGEELARGWQKQVAGFALPGPPA